MFVFLAMRVWTSWAFDISFNIVSFYCANIFLYSLNLWWYYWLLMVNSPKKNHSVDKHTNCWMSHHPACKRLSLFHSSREPLLPVDCSSQVFSIIPQCCPFPTMIPAYNPEKNMNVNLQESVMLLSYKMCCLCMVFTWLVPTFWSWTNPDPCYLWYNLYLYLTYISIPLTAVDGRALEYVGSHDFPGDHVILDRRIGDAIGCFRCVRAMRHIRATRSLHTGRPTQSKCLSSDLYNKKDKQIQSSPH